MGRVKGYEGAHPNDIRKRRQKSGQSQFALGVQAGVTPQNLAYIERGFWLPKSALLFRIAEVFGCAPSDIWPELKREGRRGKNVATQGKRG